MTRRRLFLAALCAAALPALCALPLEAAQEGTLEGVVSAAGRGVEGVAVEIYLEQKKGVGGAPFALTRSGVEGRFTLTLPPGEYYVWAREDAPSFGPPRVTEYGRNPVKVEDGSTLTLASLELREVGGSTAALPGTGVKGRVTLAGAPAADASVMIYGEGAARLKGPGYVAMAVTGPDGLFEADLAPGRYQVAVRMRRGGGLGGVLGPGDRSGEYEDNPVEVSEGAYADIGDIALHEVDPQRLAVEEKERREGAGETILAGRVTGENGKPLAGQYVFMYRDQGMIGRPDLVTVTAADGSFRFSLSEGGVWYVGARSSIGGPRQPGEMVGRLADSADSSISVTGGETLGGLLIRMEALW